MAFLLGSFSDYLNVTDAFSGTTDNVFQHILIISENYNYENGHGFSHILVPVSNYTVQIGTSRTLIDLLTVRNSFAPGIDNLNYIATPIPVLSVVSDPTPPATTTPIVLGPFNPGANRAEQFVTFVSQGITLILKAPEFGNKESYEAFRINEDTRGLVLIQYRDSFWSVGNTYDVNFTMLDYPEIVVLRNFLRLSLGQIVTYIDLYNIYHIGFITNPESAITSSGIGYSLSFTFYEAIPA